MASSRQVNRKSPALTPPQRVSDRPPRRLPGLLVPGRLSPALRLLGLLLGGLGLGLPARAQGDLTLQFVVGGLSSPVDVQAPLGDPRLFVAEQNSGLIKVVQAGSVVPTPFLNLSGQISVGGERGLLGLCFDPGYGKNRLFYVALTSPAGALQVWRYRTTSYDPNLAESWSGILVLSVAQPFANHNGGSLRFGPDGYLYIGTGDGGGSDDPLCSGQDTSSLLGKILRIDVNSIDSQGSYSIPQQNPFAGVAGARGEIMALGLRNPWRFGFDAATGGLLIGDVGEAAREELSYLNLGSGGANFGWPLMEGTLCNGPTSCGLGPLPCPPTGALPGLRPPIHEYTHDFLTGGCSIIGAAVYRGCAMPGLSGTCFFADYCSGKVWSLLTNGFSSWGLIDRTPELAPAATGGLSIVSCIAEDGFGEVLIVEHTGLIYRIVPKTPGTPCPSLRASFTQFSGFNGGLQGLSVNFGNSLGGYFYMVLGSLSGTQPGFFKDGVLVPLNLDFYSVWLAGSGAVSPLQSPFGVLTNKGAANLTLAIPPGLAASLVGLQLTHVALAIHPPTGLLRAASNPVPYKVKP